MNTNEQKPIGHQSDTSIAENSIQESPNPQNDCWNRVGVKMPEIDNRDGWYRNNKISLPCIVYIPDYGVRFGNYYGFAEKWIAEGITSSEGVNVTHWQYLPAIPTDE
jgi:hypothetical protein